MKVRVLVTSQPQAGSLKTKTITHTYHVGSDGLATRLDTHMVVLPIGVVEQAESWFDTDEIDAEGVIGCTAGTTRFDPDSGLFAVAFDLTPPLQPGIEAELAYCVRCRHTKDPANELRQTGGPNGVGTTNLAVRFAAGKPPKRVWWAHTEGRGKDPRLIGTSKRDVQVKVFDPSNPSLGFVAKLTWFDLKPHHVIGLNWAWWD